jgi:hypothetical protein
MLTYDHAVDLFKDKLARTGSLDAALLYTIWNVYKKGIEDALDGQLGGSGNEVKPCGREETNCQGQGQA